MSWQIASFALVLAALALAFWWYERSRPSAKLVAVIATLAALAALGRDAFAAVPDVKPITAIVLVSGLAFGAGPGFAVGAVSGLASNVLLGEGPWTPWQMLGWGIVGLLGAAVARIAGRQPHPLVLALSCALAAEVFNLVLDFYTWTGTGEQTLAGFGVVLAAALVFDLTHVAASFVFALAFGPALARMLARVRARLDVTWAPAAPSPPSPASLPAAAPPAAVLLIALAALALAGVAAAPSASGASHVAVPRAAARSASAASQTRAAAPAALTASPREAAAARVVVARELSYLARAQNRDGGFGAAPGQPSSELYTAWTAIGLAAAGRDPARLRRSGHSVLTALRAEAGTLQSAGDVERTILALHACGVGARSLRGGAGGLLARLLHAHAADGSFGGLSNQTAFAIFALRAAGFPFSDPDVRSAAAWLARQQNGDGGFGYGPKGGGSDVDDTAAALQALVASGRGGTTAVSRAVEFLLRAQNLDGGYPQQQGGESNAQSTAWAVQAFVAAGRDPGRITHAGSRSPLGYLESLLTGNGSVRYSRTAAQTPVWVTAQALTALAGKPFPVAPVGRGHRAGGARAGALAAALPPATAARLQARILGFAARALGVLLSSA